MISSLKKYGFGDLQTCEITEYNQDYYQYPCYDSNGNFVYRYALYPDARKKYEAIDKRVPRFWQQKDQELPPLYIYDWQTLVTSVANSSGNLHMTEGTTDAQCLITNGIRNVCAFWSTGQSINKDVTDMLHKIGAVSVYFYHHKDESGLAFAKKLHTQINGINFFVMTIPDTKDIRDLYIACDYDLSTFHEKLVSSQHLEFDTIEKHSSNNGNLLPVNFYRAVIERLGYDYESDFNSRDWSRKNVACPFKEHAEDATSPAFAFCTDGNWGYCYKCGKGFSALQIARKLGIDVNDFPNQVQAEKTDSAPQHTYKLMRDLVNNQYGRITGKSMTGLKPLPQPISIFNEYLPFYYNPSVGMFAGMSGGYKTSLLRHYATVFGSMGIHGMIWSPEWSPERAADRVLQEFGGLSMKKSRAIEAYHHYRSEPEMLKRLSLEFDIEEESFLSAKAIYNYRQSVKGELALLDPPALDFVSFKEQVRMTYNAMALAGTTPSYLITDYIQLFSETKTLSHNQMIFELKQLSIELGLFVLVSSQVTKDASRMAIRQNTQIDQTSALGVSDMASNFTVTIQPHIVDGIPKMITYEGKEYKMLAVSIVKNTDGYSSFGQAELYLFVDTERGCIITNPKTRNEVLYYIDRGDPDAFQENE